MTTSDASESEEMMAAVPTVIRPAAEPKAESPPPAPKTSSQPQAASPADESDAGRAAVAAPLASTVFASGAKIIRNGALNLVVENPTSALQGVQQIITSISGAYVANAEVRRAGDVQPTSLTLRVPAEAFDGAMNALRALAQEVLAEQVTAQDVTEEYSDVDARIRNLQAAETQLLLLLERTGTVEDLLKVENRLAEVREEIEKLQGRLNVLDNRIALATIHVLLHAPPDVSVEIVTETPPTAHTVTRFALTYRNQGSVAARETWLTLHVPEHLSVIDVGRGGRFDPTVRAVHWSLGDIAPGTEGRVYANLRVVSAANDILLIAEIYSASVDANSVNNAVSKPLTFAPDLALEAEGPASAAQGSDITIWVSYGNVGTADASDVTIEATLPPGLTFVRASFGGSYDSETGAVIWETWTRASKGERPSIYAPASGCVRGLFADSDSCCSRRI